MDGSLGASNGGNGAASSAPGAPPGGSSGRAAPLAAGSGVDSGATAWPGPVLWPGMAAWPGASAAGMGLEARASGMSFDAAMAAASMSTGVGSWPGAWTRLAMAAGMPPLPRSATTTTNPPSDPQSEDTRVAQRGQKQGRGGRRTRKGSQPAPAAPTRRDDADVVNLTDSSVADWCDDNVRIACEIFAEEVRIGNRSNTHLNKAGYQNVIKKFKDRTSLVYTRVQFKNKWDKMKGEYAI